MLDIDFNIKIVYRFVRRSIKDWLRILTLIIQDIIETFPLKIDNILLKSQLKKTMKKKENVKVKMECGEWRREMKLLDFFIEKVLL